MDIKVFGLDGNATGKVTLPEPFTAAQRPDLIRKAVSVAQANRRQPYGASPMAGRWHTHRSWGPGHGVSRVPRGTQTSKATFAPCVVGGRRAHPPRVAKVLTEKLNKKERRVALRAALAAVADKAAVTARGHRFELDAVPLVVEDSLVNVSTTKEFLQTLGKLGVATDVERSKDGTGQRAGRGKLRGRRYRTPTSILVVVHEEGAVSRACRNLSGVEWALTTELSVERLAPGGHAGRLTLFTRSALAQVAEVAR